MLRLYNLRNSSWVVFLLGELAHHLPGPADGLLINLLPRFGPKKCGGLILDLAGVVAESHQHAVIECRDRAILYPHQQPHKIIVQLALRSLPKDMKSIPHRRLFQFPHPDMDSTDGAIRIPLKFLFGQAQIRQQFRLLRQLIDPAPQLRKLYRPRLLGMIILL